ncbi:uncharacterized protein LOC119589709 [Penaeus monodon]|uniref:uncharacterized protein LOC119589709 n=1 Tax=Penaeus monodon TaxID=6687 RepID=UPI0018A74BEE|nr:uncharacterized protein LOC119589709 [Penaeus monodon]
MGTQDCHRAIQSGVRAPAESSRIRQKSGHCSQVPWKLMIHRYWRSLQDTTSTLLRSYRTISPKDSRERVPGFTWPWIHGWLKKLFADQRGGFFVEAGALDGEYLSNTLWLERDLGWSGLLVEAAVSSFKELRFKHRKSWVSNACLSPTPYPKRIPFVNHFLTDAQLNTIDFSTWAYRGHSHEFRQDIPQADFGAHDHSSYSVVQCFPLLSFLKALNVTQVDLLSLDTQGSEADIVRSFLGSDGIKVRVIVAENEFGKFDEKMMSEMKENGYLLLARLADLVFVRRDDPVWQHEGLIRILQDDTGQINGYKISFKEFKDSLRRNA